ncbi:MAG: helix-turn-helix domain-containing protein [Terriglobales bacterium]
MSIFGKPLSQHSTADLQELLTEKAVENVRLEFKLQVPTKDETLKKLSSFGNTFGGFMVIGARANSADGRLEGLPGVDEEAGYKQKVVDWCFNGASPPLSVEVSDPIPAPEGNGKVCYVVHTPESDNAPHFLNGRKGIWVRTDEFSARYEAQLAHENELRHLLERRKLIRERRISLLERARNRFDTYAAKGHTARSGHRTNFGPRLELCIVPRFPSRPLCDQARLAPLIREKPFRWRGITFPVSGSSTISQHESAIVLGAAGDDSMFEANVWGMVFYCTKIADADNPVHAFGIHLYGFVGTIMLFMRHAETILRTLGYSGPLHVQMSLHGMRDVQWLYGSTGIYTQNGSVLDDDVEFSIPTTSDGLRENLDGVLMDILRYVFFSVNWPGLIDQQSKLEDLLRSGYQYNMWFPPESWQP